MDMFPVIFCLEDAANGMKTNMRFPYLIEYALYIINIYSLNTGVLFRCSQCMQQSVTGSSFHAQFIGTYDHVSDPRCPSRKIYRQQDVVGHNDVYIIRYDYSVDFPEDTVYNKIWYFTDASDACGSFNAFLIRSPVTTDQDAHEVFWEEYRTGLDWWRTSGLLIQCVGKNGYHT